MNSISISLVVMLSYILSLSAFFFKNSSEKHLKKDSLVNHYNAAFEMLGDFQLWYSILMISCFSLALLSCLNTVSMINNDDNVNLSNLSYTYLILFVSAVLSLMANSFLNRQFCDSNRIVVFASKMLLSIGIFFYLMKDLHWVFIPVFLVSFTLCLALHSSMSQIRYYYRANSGCGIILIVLYGLIIFFGLDTAINSGNIDRALLFFASCTFCLSGVKYFISQCEFEFKDIDF
ncbi:hypothetical protein [Vibrio sagamiensis]|uniref:Uncharacterized protein n=1 Tax=Vibrio sagamiensis NBRC 104589 TaxID=1219064 RepID=A0A511QD87_9VIBR|nr:hypothetical protein [Vibrio sagamiensis]GEM75263.1 hypothetical protein VSA01S_13750 [Vibrio sagamiensis NBRC 104589]